MQGVDTTIANVALPHMQGSLSVTGNFGAGSGSGALMKGSRFAADSMLEGDGFELSVPRQRISVCRLILSVACEG